MVYFKYRNKTKKGNMISYLQLSKEIPQRSHVDYPTLTMEDVKLSTNALSKMQQEDAWVKIHNYLDVNKENMLGYQNTQKLSDVLKDFSSMHINNAGDPFTRGHFGVNTKMLECAVLDYFAKLWHVDLSDEDGEKKYWGYIVSMGCTEANMYALYNARDYLSGEPLLGCEMKGTPKPACQVGGKCPQGIVVNARAFIPVAFFSESAHYGLTKSMRVLRISTFYDLGSGYFPCPLTHPDDYPSDYDVHLLDQNNWPRLVPVNSDGSMHVPSLVKLVSSFTSRGYPPIVIFTCGSSFRGSYDNSQAAIEELVPVLKEHGLYDRRVYNTCEDPSKFDVRRGFWFHSDGALGASYLPFLEMAIDGGEIENDFPNGFPVFDFRIPEVMSISTSLHKWLGCPFPAGLYMMRKKYQLQPPTNPLFIGGGDTTFAGSRNAHGAIAMWDLLSRKSYKDLTEDAVRHTNMVEFILNCLRELEKDLVEDLWLSHIPGSLFICLKQPRQDIVLKYSLAYNVYPVRNKQGELERKRFAHICVMSHVNQELVERFVEDLRGPGAFPLQDV